MFLFFSFSIRPEIRKANSSQHCWYCALHFTSFNVYPSHDHSTLWCTCTLPGFLRLPITSRNGKRARRIVDQYQVKEDYHLGVEDGWKAQKEVKREVRKIPRIYLHDTTTKIVFRRQRTWACLKEVPEDGYLIAEILHIFSSQILLQENLDGNICSIPNAAKNFSKEPWRLHIENIIFTNPGGKKLEVSSQWLSTWSKHHSFNIYLLQHEDRGSQTPLRDHQRKVNFQSWIL